MRKFVLIEAQQPSKHTITKRKQCHDMSQSFLAYFHKILDVFLNVQFSNYFILSITKSLKMLKETGKIIVLYFSTYIIERNKKV